MALKTAIGALEGDVNDATLQIRVWDDAGATIDRDAALTAALAAAPGTKTFDGATLYPSGSPSITDLSSSAVMIGVQYAVPEVTAAQPPEPPASGSLTRRAGAVAKSVRRYSFIAPVGVYEYVDAATDDVTEFYDHTKWKIDLQTDDRDRRHAQGTSFDPLPETRTLDYFLPNGELTDAYIDAIEALVVVGAFNDDTFFGKPAGSVQIVRFSSADRGDDTELSFGFGYKPPEDDVLVDGFIELPTVRACDYWWTLDRETYNETSKIVEVVAKLAILGQVWPLLDFSDLDLPGM